MVVESELVMEWDMDIDGKHYWISIGIGVI